MKVRRMTALGVPLERKEIKLPGGAREVRTRWLARAAGQKTEWEAGTITSATYKGNALRGTLRVLVPEHVVEEF